MIFRTNVSMGFQQNIYEVALFCVKNLESSFIYVMKQSFKSLSKLIQYTNEIQNVIQIVIQNIVEYLNDDRSKKESYEKVTDNAVVALTYSFIKYPNYQQNDLLHLWLVNLPVYNGDGKMVHKVFADLLKSNMMFFLHDENVESTIEIIATLCRSTWINEETRNCFWGICKFVFGHEPKLESVYKAADSLSDARKNRLFDFLKTYKSM